MFLTELLCSNSSLCLIPYCPHAPYTTQLTEIDFIPPNCIGSYFSIYLSFPTIFFFWSKQLSKRNYNLYTFLPKYQRYIETNITMIFHVNLYDAYAHTVSQVIRPGYTAQQAHIFID